jgi:hypothetical protein
MLQDLIVQYNDAVTGIVCVIIFTLPAILSSSKSFKK